MVVCVFLGASATKKTLVECNSETIIKMITQNFDEGSGITFVRLNKHYVDDSGICRCNIFTENQKKLLMLLSRITLLRTLIRSNLLFS